MGALPIPRGGRTRDSRPAGSVVVPDMPLLVRTGQASSFGARARIAAQATDAERRAVADVLDNSGTLEQLAEQVDRFWAERVEGRQP